MFQHVSETFDGSREVLMGKGEMLMRAFGFPEFLIVVLFFGLFLLLPFLVLRYRKQVLNHQERMAALEKGVPLPAVPIENGAANPRIYLLRGLIWLFGGIGLIVFLLGLALTTLEPVPLSTRLFDAQRLRADGGTEAQVNQLINSQETRRGVPIGLSLIGLVPVGVGLAYLFFYAGEKKQHI